MKQLKDKKLLILFILSLISIYILLFRVIPSMRGFYKLRQVLSGRSNTVKTLRMRLYRENNVKPFKFTAGNHRFSTDLLTVLSYIRYLKEAGLDVRIKIINRKNIKIKNSDLKIVLSDFSDIGVVFSLLNTLKAFPFEIKKISIKSGKKIDAVIGAKLIGFYNK